MENLSVLEILIIAILLGVVVIAWSIYHIIRKCPYTISKRPRPRSGHRTPDVFLTPASNHTSGTVNTSGTADQGCSIRLPASSNDTSSDDVYTEIDNENNIFHHTTTNESTENCTDYLHVMSSNKSGTFVYDGACGARTQCVAHAQSFVAAESCSRHIHDLHVTGKQRISF